MSIGLKRGPIVVNDYDINWSKFAKQQIDKLWNIFETNENDKVVVDIQHIGSTSIIGMKSKPIIDLVVGVIDLTKIDQFIDQLVKEGLIIHTTNNLSDEVLITDKNDANDMRSYHIHVVEINSQKWNDYIGFRDFLNSNKIYAKKYEALKVDLANAYKFDRAKYTRLKNELINEILGQVNLTK